MRNSGTLAATRIDGPIITASRKRFMYFVLPPVRWSFRSRLEQEQLILQAAERYGQLSDRRLHLRVTSRPYAAEQWARELGDNSPNALPGWSDYLKSEQKHIIRLTIADKIVFLGVELHEPRMRHHRAAAEQAKIAAIIGGPGLNGRPATAEEFEFLMRRSVGLGAHAPRRQPDARWEWDDTDMAEFTDRADWSAKPYDRAVRMVTDIDGVQQVRYVVTVSLCRMAELDIPGRTGGPWLQKSDQVFPVEWSVIADALTPEKTRKQMRDLMLRIGHQDDHYREHELDPPLALDRQKDRALQIEDEVATGDLLAIRFNTWVRGAVSGATEREAIDQAQQLIDLYGGSMTFERTAGQFAVAREFIPGEQLSSIAHRRKLPAATFAAALPQATALVGDRVGIHLGYTAGTSQRAVCWDTHRSMEIREASGLTVVAGGLGAGKSSLIGSIVYQSAFRGIRTVVLDPSGPLARLVTMPELAPVSRAVDLMDAEPGALSPFRVIGDPQPQHFDDPLMFERAVAAAESRRRALCNDVLRMTLPAQVARLPETRKVLKTAGRVVGGHRGASARQVIKALYEDQSGSREHAAYVAEELDEIASMPQAQLIFPEANFLDEIGSDEYVLQVLTMRGNVLPKAESDAEDWSVEERLGMPLLHLASHMTVQHVYSASMHERKLIAMDELHDLTRVGSGRALIKRITRDSRKWNLRALLASQNITDALEAGIENFVDSAFIGRTVDHAAQQAALKVLGIELDAGYEQELGGLSPIERQSSLRSGYRDFVFNDGDGGIEKIRIHIPDRLVEVLDTTADPSKALANA